jgi:hypothetical protein
MQSMLSSVVLVGTACVQTSAWNVRTAGSSDKFLGNLQPEVAAHTLVEVEKEWQTQVAAFVACNASASATATGCSGASLAFEKSCTEVVDVAVKVSKGDKAVVREYWSDVCGELSRDEPHKKQCELLASMIDAKMSPYAPENREVFNTAEVCNLFWKDLSGSENQRAQQELATRRVEEKAAAEKAKAKAAAQKLKAKEAAKKLAGKR